MSRLYFEPSCAPAVQGNRQDFSEPDEIAIRRQNREAAALGRGADQKIRIGALHAFRPTGVEVLGRALESADSSVSSGNGRR